MKHAPLFLALKFLLGALLIALLAGGIAAVARPQQTMTVVASHVMGRPVTFGSAAVSLTSLLNFEFDDVHIDNPPWAEDPDMVRIGTLAGSLDPSSLLSGEAKFLKLYVNDATLVLERDDHGVGNWKNQKTLERTPLSPHDEASESRRSFPTVLDFVLENGHIIIHTSSGARLTVDLAKVILKTDAPDQPVTLTADGAYNKLPVFLNIETQSFDQLHDADQPFAAKISAQGNSVALRLDLRLMDPINFDQLKGTMHAGTKNLGAAAAYFGGGVDKNVPLNFDTVMARQGDHWDFAASEGTFAGNPFSQSDLVLDEGKRLQPDAIKTTLNFAKLYVDTLLDKARSGNGKGTDKIAWLDAGRHPSALLDNTIRAKKVHYKSETLSDLEVHGFIADGASGIRSLSFNAFGGSASGNAVSTIKGNGNLLKAVFGLTHMQADQLIRLVRDGKPVIKGDVNLIATFKAEGDTIPEIAGSLNGRAALRIIEGQAAKWASHLMASDIRTVFDDKAELTPLRCMHAVVNFINGVGRLSPFIFQTSEGTMLGQGSVDLPDNTIALVFQTDPKTTSMLALDVPINIHGALTDPAIGMGRNHTPPLENPPTETCNE